VWTAARTDLHVVALGDLGDVHVGDLDASLRVNQAVGGLQVCTVEGEKRIG